MLTKQLWVRLTQQFFFSSSDAGRCRLMMIEMIETCCGTNIGRGEEELLR
jgi:hypothetical protein